MANGEKKRKRRKRNRKLLPGEKVEVLSTDEGLVGSWHIAVVIDCGEQSRLVEYTDLLCDDNHSKLKESIPASAAVEGLMGRLPRSYRGHMRPSPPYYYIQGSEIKYGICVDAWLNDAWWEGVVFDREEGSSERLVLFPDQGDQQMVAVEQLRVTQEWNEISGHWKARGEWLLLQALQPFDQEGSLPVSIREFWFDLRATAAFSDRIGDWPFGSQSVWNSLVSELNQELCSVAHKAVTYSQIVGVPSSVALSMAKSYNSITQKFDDDDCGCEKNDSPDRIRSKFVRKESRSSQKRVSNKSWQPLSLEAECCPEAVIQFACRYEDGGRQIKKLKMVGDNFTVLSMKAKKHLLALGWKIESTTREEGKSYLRFRFIAPDGNTYYTLHEACHGLLNRLQKDQNCRNHKHTDGSCTRSNMYESLPARCFSEPACFQEVCPAKRNKCKREYSSLAAGLYPGDKDLKSNEVCENMHRPCSKAVNSGITEISSNALEESCPRADTDHAMICKENLVPIASGREFLIYNDLEPGYCPEAVLKYKNYMDSRGNGKRKFSNEDPNQMRLNVKEHLISIGWKIDKQQEYCITSPSGKSFRSLYSACGAYLEEALLNNNTEVSVKEVEGRKEHGVSTLYSKRKRNAKKRKRVSRFSSFTFAAMGGRLLKPPSSRSIRKKMDKRKTLKALIKQRHKSGRFSQRVERSSKRSREIATKTHTPQVARTVLSLLIDNNMILPRQKVCYIRRRDGHVMKEGRITRDGIKCKCCRMVFNLSNFESHAGSNNRRPSANIFLQDGRSLLQCQMQLLQNKKPNDFRRTRLKSNSSCYKSDTLCSVCHDCGSLVLCDQCPSSFHLDCVGLKDVPKGKWFCPSCRCGICGLSDFNSDIEHFTDQSVLYCDQCEREYHVGCMRKRGHTKLSSCPIGNWFCSRKCSKIFVHMRNLLGKSRPSGIEGLSWTILRSGRENGSDYEQFDSETMLEHDSKLCVALEVLHECFVTIIEPRTRSDFIADLIFNRESELKRLNFYGFYTMLLERGDEVISVATFRVYGEKVAEMPLVGTRFKYRRQGMCRLIVNELEQLLSAMGVERLVLPAVPQLLPTWTTSFGFTEMSSSEKSLFSEYTVLNFEDTTLCQKLLRAAPKALAKPKGVCKEQKDMCSRCIERADSAIYSNVSEVVEMAEPVKTLPPLSIGTCPLPGEVDFEPISYQNDDANSPSVSGYINPVGQTVQDRINCQVSVNIASDICRDSDASMDTSQTVVVKPSLKIRFKLSRKCDENIGKSGTIIGRLTKSINGKVAGAFKNFYSRRLSANKQPLVPQNDLASC